MAAGNLSDVPQRIAVLGGGMAALTAVFQLTSTPGWQDKYHITVYQMGWRLGGKGASGRNPQYFDRIEEHGLHVWFGCYDNAWRVIRACYAENGRKPGEPLATIEEAFEPAYSFVGMEQVGKDWVKWPIRFPSNDKVPGIDMDEPSIWDHFRSLIRRLTAGIMTAHLANAFGETPLNQEEARVFRNIHDVFSARFTQLLRFTGMEVETGDVYSFVDNIDEILDSIRESGDFSTLISGLTEARNWLWEELTPWIMRSHNLRRMWLMFDLITANLLGMIKDEVLFRGYEAINHLDYREWVARHSKTPEITCESSVVQAFYSVIFAGHKQHTFEAGYALKGALRIALSYKGAYFYRMNAGMGDVVFTPLYQVLKRRGVQFEFFHKVRHLGLSKDGHSIQSITIDRQATPKNGAYQPLVRIKGLDCWPSYPLYTQLIEGADLQEKEINLESDWAQWKPAETIQLQQGRDFDHVLLGISVAALPAICGELIQAKGKWRNMVTQVKTTPTLAFQAWLRPDINGLGWPLRHLGRPLTGTFAQPLDTNSDMSNLLPRESWPLDNQPGMIAHLCGKLPLSLPDPAQEPDFPAKARRKVITYARDYLRQFAQYFWPHAILPDGSLDVDLLAAPLGLEGEERLLAQYFRANIDRTEQYVLSETGTSQYRLKAGGSGFRNLTLTGDWIDTGFNVGCIEAAVMAGLQAARAISGTKERIPGEVDATLEWPSILATQRNAIKGQMQKAFLSLFKTMS